MCSKCNNSINNSVFAEIVQQYLSNIGIALIEYDIKFKKLSFYDLYIPSKNLLIEIQSKYHDNKIEFDNQKKLFAESKGYNVEWVDSRTEDLLSFINRFDKNATWDSILSMIDLSKMINKKLIQLDLQGNLIKVWHGGMSEINKVLSLSISKLSLASRGKYGEHGHYFSGYLWYLETEYNNLNFCCKKVTDSEIHRVNIKNNNYKYIALKDNIKIIANTAKELAELINSNNSNIIACINGRRKYTRGFLIYREIYNKENYCE